MFLYNAEDILSSTNIIKVNRQVGKYLTKHGFPQLSVDDYGNFLFAKTPELENGLKELPIYLKVLNIKEGR